MPIRWAETKKFLDPTADGEERAVLLEMRSTGCQTLLPGSVHPNGEMINWHTKGEPATVEAEVLERAARRCAAASLLARRWPRSGARQEAALALSGGLLRSGMDSGDAADFMRAVATAAGDEEAAKRATAPDFTAARLGQTLPATGWPHLAELIGEAAVKKAAEWLDVEWRERAGDGSRSRSSQADELVRIGERCELFHDGRGTAIAAIQVKGHTETWPLNSKLFKNWLRREHYRATGKAVSSESVNTAVATLEGMACFDGPQYEMGNRVTALGDAIYYDLADEAWQVVMITKGGLRVTSPPRPLFRRFAHQQVQALPAATGDPWQLFRFVNVKQEHRLLLLVWLVAAFVPDIPHPILDFHGEKGAGKSVGQKVLRSLIDPSAAMSLSFPRNITELVQQLSHHYAPVYDNVDTLQPWLSDCLCRAVTGEGFSKRELFTNDEDVIYAYRRVVLLNGINVSARRSDLLDRTILIELERISRRNRQSEQAFWSDFSAAKPAILAGVFGALARAMELYDELRVADLERMADFTRWGAAIAEALGVRKEDFLNAYGTNIGNQNREALAGSLVGSAVQRLMAGRQDWSGTPTKLLEDLEDVAVTNRLVRRSPSGRIETKGWPGAPQILTRRMNEVRSNLLEAGIEVRKARDDERRIVITWLAGGESSVDSVGTVDADRERMNPADATDATDATFQASTAQRLVL
jgi:hypothetical protein